jgi:hypothetical protein
VRPVARMASPAATDQEPGKQDHTGEEECR